MPIGYNTFNPIQGDVFYIVINFLSHNTSNNPQGYLLIDSLAIVPETVTGMETLNHPKIKLTPNPAKEKIKIEGLAQF